MIVPRENTFFSYSPFTHSSKHWNVYCYLLLSETWSSATLTSVGTFLLWQTLCPFAVLSAVHGCCDKQCVLIFAMKYHILFYCDNHHIPFADKRHICFAVTSIISPLQWQTCIHFVVTTIISLLLWQAPYPCCCDYHHVTFSMTSIVSLLLWQTSYPHCCDKHYILFAATIIISGPQSLQTHCLETTCQCCLYYGTIHVPMLLIVKINPSTSQVVHELCTSKTSQPIACKLPHVRFSVIFNLFFYFIFFGSAQRYFWDNLFHSEQSRNL